MTARSAAPPDCGRRCGSVIVGKLLKKNQYNYGFGSQTCEYGNLVTKGIDPIKVVRAAAWAAWTSDPATQATLQGMQTPAAMPGFLFRLRCAPKKLKPPACAASWHDAENSTCVHEGCRKAYFSSKTS